MSNILIAQVEGKKSRPINESRLNGLRTATQDRISFKTAKVHKTQHYEHYGTRIEAFLTSKPQSIPE